MDQFCGPRQVGTDGARPLTVPAWGRLTLISHVEHQCVLTVVDHSRHVLDCHELHPVCAVIQQVSRDVAHASVQAGLERFTMPDRLAHWGSVEQPYPFVIMNMNTEV